MTARTGPDHERWEDAVGAYLLDALPDDERAGFEAHLDACPACREEAEHLGVASAALPASVRQYAPPPELKHRIMAVVNAEAELLQAAGARADVPAPAGRPAREGRRLSWWPVRPWALAAATTAVLVVGVFGGALLRESQSGPDVRTVAADVASTGATAELIVRDEHSSLVARKLPHPGQGRVYQVWLKRRGVKDPEPTDALFTVRHDGSAAVDVPGRLDDVEAVMVTSEPDGGSVAPTRTPIIVASPA